MNLDPMEIVARKIRRGETLYLKDLKYWVAYNFLAFQKEDQLKVKELNERQQWFWRRMSILIPPVWYGFFAIFRYQFKLGVVKNFVVSTGMIGVLVKIGLFSSDRDMKNCYSKMYEQYGDEVLSPKYRGLKLYGGKKAHQIDDKEFTSSNFDDLKQILFK